MSSESSARIGGAACADEREANRQRPAPVVFRQADGRDGVHRRECSGGYRSAAAASRKPFEQRAEFAGAEEILRVPLHAEAEARRGILDRLDDAVGRGRGRDEAGRDRLDRLMMAAVHGDRLVHQPFAHQSRQQRILVDPDVVRQLVGQVLRHRQAVRQRAGDLRRDVLHQRAAAGDVQDLHAAADRENRQVAPARRGNQRDLELVPSRLRLLDRGMRRFAVSRRRHVGAAGQQETADAGERLLDRHRQVEDARLAADMEDRLPVVFELPARCDANHGHSYIRFGTSMPIRSSARVSCART